MKRSGLTLLEVVVALSLSAMMLIALNGVLSSFVRQKKWTNIDRNREWAYQLDRLFWNDLAQADGVALNPVGLVMTIPTGANLFTKSRASLTNGASNCTVVYHLIPYQSGLNRLARSVFAGNETRGTPLFSQTLLWDVREATFERVDDSGESQPLPRERGPTPRAFRYQLWIGSESSPRANQILVR